MQFFCSPGDGNTSAQPVYMYVIQNIWVFSICPPSVNLDRRRLEIIKERAG